MNLKIAMCDDEIINYKNLKSYLDIYIFSTDDEISLEYFPSGEDLLKTYNKPHCFDIIFMDIEMTGALSGLETAQRIRELPDNDVKITILSNYPQYLQDGYHVSAHSFLIKPLEYNDFKEEMDLLIADIKKTDRIIPVSISHDTTCLIHLSTLMYVSTSKSIRGRTRLSFHTTTDVITTIGTLKDYEDKFKTEGFASPYKGFLVNLRYIKMIVSDTIILNNNEKIPLSKNTYRDFIAKYAKIFS